MLECQDGTLYTGWTNDIEQRLQKHQKGLASKYTRSRLPVKLVYLEEAASKKAALQREMEIKKLSRRQKLMLINQPEQRQS
jgi:putative endonuclease